MIAVWKCPSMCDLLKIQEPVLKVVSVDNESMCMASCCPLCGKEMMYCIEKEDKDEGEGH